MGSKMVGESGEGSCKRELAGSIGISPAAANGHATAFSTKMKGLRRNHNCGTIADAIAGLHAELHGDGSGIVVYGVDGVTGSGSGVRNEGEVESVFWRGEVEYEEVTVWRRDRILGRWLRRLWMSHPSTRPAIQVGGAKMAGGGEKGGRQGGGKLSLLLKGQMRL
ncbi:hypothetical protein Vafri_15579 [Volvox africanus]|uniref:Uncharacterized protein n=1 Tax=Volvox africanus TaxID=51714 RepID=A0A8J4F5X0_9CHLO|nr:hypothetical protein Vafri_15579 [Volvox africanus]